MDKIGSLDITLSSDNGSVPPPYRRSSVLHIAADRSARIELRRGYDLTDSDATWMQAFSVDRDRWLDCLAVCDRLRVWSTPWQEVDRPNVGGSSVIVQLRDGVRHLHIPAQPLQAQREAKDDLVAAIRALVPEDVLRTQQQWQSPA